MPSPLVLLMLCNLVIGTAAFVVSGILAPVAADLGVGIAAAGQSMTAYALATAVLAPLALMATGRWPRKRVLLVALALFTLGNAVSALAPNLATLVAGRVLMGVGAVFTPVAASIAVTVVEPARRGQALAFVFLGMSLSYVVGVPLGAWLGLRYGWQVPVWLVTALSALALAAVALRVPADVAAPGAGFAGLGTLLARRGVQAVLGLTLLYFVAIFAVFSYIGPVLQALQPMSDTRLSLTLALFGVSGVAGTLIGGAANDRFGALPTLRVQLALLGTMMALLPLTAGHWWAMVAVLMAWGTAGFGMMAPQQSRLVHVAPAQAPVLLSLNSSMLYVGTAIGAVVGGAATLPLGLANLSWIGVPLALAGLALLWRSAPTTPVAAGGAAR
jgi:DHA1 family inner membrane transport protein